MIVRKRSTLDRSYNFFYRIKTGILMIIRLLLVLLMSNNFFAYGQAEMGVADYSTFAQELDNLESLVKKIFAQSSLGADATQRSLEAESLKSKLLQLCNKIDDERNQLEKQPGESAVPKQTRFQQELVGLRGKAFHLLLLLQAYFVTVKKTAEKVVQEGVPKGQDVQSPQPSPKPPQELSLNEEEEASDEPEVEEEPESVTEPEIDVEEEPEPEEEPGPAVEPEGDREVDVEEESKEEIEEPEPVLDPQQSPNKETHVPDEKVDAGVLEVEGDDPLASISQLFNESNEKKTDHPEYYFLNREVLDKVTLNDKQLNEIAQKKGLSKENVAWMISLAKKAHKKVQGFTSIKNITEFLAWLISFKNLATETSQGSVLVSADFTFYPESSRNKDWLAYFLEAIKKFSKKIGGKTLFEKLKDNKDAKNQEHIKKLYDAAKEAGCTEVLRSYNIPEPPVTGAHGEILLTTAQLAQQNQQTIEVNKNNAQKAQELTHELLSLMNDQSEPELKSKLDDLLKEVSIKAASESRTDSGGAASQAGQEKKRKEFNSELVNFKKFFLDKKDLNTLDDTAQSSLKIIFAQLVNSFSSMRASQRSERKVLKYGSTEDPRDDLSADEYEIGYNLYLSAYTLVGKIADVGNFDEGITKELKQALKKLYDELKEHYEKNNILDKLPAPPIIREKKRTQEEQAKIDKNKNEQEVGKKNQGDVTLELKKKQEEKAQKDIQEKTDLFLKASPHDLLLQTQKYQRAFETIIDRVTTTVAKSSYNITTNTIPEVLPDTFYDQSFALLLKLKEAHEEDNALFAQEYDALRNQLLTEPYKKDLVMFDKKILAEANKPELSITPSTREGLQKLLTHAISRLLQGYEAIKKYYSDKVPAEAIKIPREMIFHGIQLYNKIGDFIGKRSMGTLVKKIKLEDQVIDPESKKETIPSEKEFVEKLYSFLSDNNVKKQAEEFNLKIPDKDTVNEEKNHGSLATDQSTENKKTTGPFSKPAGPGKKPSKKGSGK